MVLPSSVAVPKKVAFEAGMIRPWISMSPRVSSAWSSSLMARPSPSVQAASGLGGGAGAAEAVGPRAEVPGGVHRAAAEGARLPTGPDDGLGPLAEGPGESGGQPHDEHLLGLGLVDLLLGGAGLDDRGVVEGEDLDHDAFVR